MTTSGTVLTKEFCLYIIWKVCGKTVDTEISRICSKSVACPEFLIKNVFLSANGLLFRAHHS